MRLNPRLLKDTLTLKTVSEGAINPNTGEPSGTVPAPRVLITQKCSDQDVSPSRRFSGVITSGVAGSLPISICYTAYFTPPVLQPGESLVVEVNGRVRPLMRQGPPQDIGGQHAVMELELGAPQS